MMAKCPVCNARKAKRKCLITPEGRICSLCCGETRKEETCSGCVYYQPPEARRKYNDVPSYTPSQMDTSEQLQSYAFAIEAAIGAFDRKMGGKIRDEIPIGIFEKLLDKHYFKDKQLTFASKILEDGFTEVDRVIESDLSGIDEDELIKVLGVLHFVAKRRTRGRREYLSIVQQFVGERLGPGLRAIHLPPASR